MLGIRARKNWEDWIKQSNIFYTFLVALKMLPSIKKNYAQELLTEGENKRTDFRSSREKRWLFKNPSQSVLQLQEGRNVKILGFEVLHSQMCSFHSLGFAFLCSRKGKKMY